MKRTTTLWLTTGTLLMVALGVACDGDVKDKVSDAVSDEPQRSYCEALCDWSVDCAEAERGDYASSSLASDCDAATNAADSQCAEAEAGSLGATDSLAVTECVDDVDAEATDGACDSFTGSYDDLVLGTPPATCFSLGADAQATFDAAQDSTAESGDDLCERFTGTFCEMAVECLIGDYELPEEAIKNVGEPQDLCEQSMSSITTKCQTDELYAYEDGLTDINTARQSARECLGGIETMTCSELFSGDFSDNELCASSFADAEAMLDFATGLLSFGCLFSDYVPGLDCGE